MFKKSGIYTITNIVTGVVYLGRSTDIFRRWSHHYDALMKGTRHCPELQQAWDAGHEDEFVFEIHKSCSPELLVEEEKRCYLALSSVKTTYNVTFREDHRPGAVLNVDQVREIKRRLVDGESSKSVSLDYAVGESTIQSIKKGRSWADVSV